MKIEINTIPMNGQERAQAVYVDGKHFIPAHGPVISPEMWEKLERAERDLYRGEVGANSYTGVMCYDEFDDFLGQLWSQAQIAVENHPDWSEASANSQMNATARRVAQALAVISFGPEFLLK
jgi:hypothetical protein